VEEFVECLVKTITGQNKFAMKVVHRVLSIQKLFVLATSLILFHTCLQFSVLNQMKLIESFPPLGNYEALTSHSDMKAVNSPKSKSTVAILICSKSVKRWRNVSDTTLYTILLPSLERTIDMIEIQRFSIQVYVAYDSVDNFYTKSLNRIAIISTCQFNLTFISITKRVRNKIPFNAIARVAMSMGSDFFVRINDDSEFVSAGWISEGIRTLESFVPRYVGVVGPNCPDGNTKILTHDMVHRTHLDIFGDYYPDVFDNFFVDDWISSVYGANRTKKIVSWLVRHHTQKHGTRYRVRVKKIFHLNTTIITGQRKIQDYLAFRINQFNMTHRVSTWI
jgi:hypothetical protein